jgi:uncharacterized protein YndB with AHSA1/START domain
MTDSYVNVTYLPHPPERVWDAITDSAALEKWLMPNSFKPVMGHEFTFRTEPVPPHFDGVVHCRVTEIEPPHRLAYTWVGGPISTFVTYRLDAEGEGTRLRFEHGGFDLTDPGQQMAFEAMSQGWKDKIETKFHEVVEELAAAASRG